MGFCPGVIESFSWKGSLKATWFNSLQWTETPAASSGAQSTIPLIMGVCRDGAPTIPGHYVLGRWRMSALTKDCAFTSGWEQTISSQLTVCSSNPSRDSQDREVQNQPLSAPCLQTAFHGEKAETTVQEAGRGVQLFPSFLTSLPPRRDSATQKLLLFSMLFLICKWHRRSSRWEGGMLHSQPCAPARPISVPQQHSSRGAVKTTSAKRKKSKK